MKLAVLKLGGSILSDSHSGRPQVRRALLARMPTELQDCERLVLVHGSGEFGKPPAREYHYVDGQIRPGNAALISAVTAGLEVLHEAVLAAIRDGGRAAFSFQAAHLFEWRSGQLDLLGRTVLDEMLARGLTPVLASGFVPNRDSGGFTVASSDEMASLVAVRLGADFLGFATEAHGVYIAFPRTDAWHDCLSDSDIESLERVERVRGDVTGGMALKLGYGFDAARQGVRTLVLDGRVEGNLAAALRGDSFIGTRLVAGPTPPSTTGDDRRRLEREFRMSSSNTAARAIIDGGLVADIDALRSKIDGRMRRLFDELERSGPMAADPVVRMIYRWSNHYLGSGGQRMHGIAVWLVYEAFGGKDLEAALKVASAIQLYHHHTMVHDDVYDEDTSRRRWPTTHVAFADWYADRGEGGAPTRLFGSDPVRRGAVSAIAYGKIMRALALYGVGVAGFPAEPTLAVSNLLNWHDLFDCAGQIKDVDFESRELPSSQACIDNAWLKTGRLFEICARIGAILAGANPEQQDAAAVWAGNAGVAYQIQDDLEDIVPASEKGVGRGIGLDLLYCKPTYLYALTRELASGVDRERLGQWESGDRSPAGVQAIIDIIERSGARARVENKVSRLLGDGAQALAAAGLPAATVARMDQFVRYFVSPAYWQRELADGLPTVTTLFQPVAAAATAPSYPGNSRDSALHGLPALRFGLPAMLASTPTPMS